MGQKAMFRSVVQQRKADRHHLTQRLTLYGCRR
jgi:hypothetical protein